MQMLMRTAGGGANACKCGKHHCSGNNQLSGAVVLDYAEICIMTGPVQNGYINFVRVQSFIDDGDLCGERAGYRFST